jgi:RNA polymerase sigma factor (sigma-70 family)
MAMPLTDDTDAGLLRQFTRERSETAFRRLTERHVDLVFGTAFRRIGEWGAAEEITQSVFVTLARKAAWLQNEMSLAAWLHRTTVLESHQWWRGEIRRRQREQTAAELETTMKTSAENSPAMAGVLDEALLELREGERQAVLLRFFEGRNHREIGAALGIGEDAARKRVDKAMAQMMTFFRKRGFAVGSAIAMVASMEGAAQAAPISLASAAVRAALSAGGTTAPWLGKLLGMGKMQLAGLGLLVMLLPAVWQEARLYSARAEQRRMAALLTDLQQQHAAVGDHLAQVQRQITRALADVDAVQSNSMAVSAAIDAGELDPRLFLWNEQVGYVRVPKAVVDRIAFDGSKGSWRVSMGVKETLDKVRGRISPNVLGALGLNAAEQSSAQELFNRHFSAYREWADTNSYLAEISEVAEKLPKYLTDGSFSDRINDDTRVWVTPRILNDAQWREQFQQELETVIGEERASILLRMANDDGSLLDCLQQFAEKRMHLVVTPNPKGGFWLIQVGEHGYSGSTQGTFSEVLNPVPEEKFDEEKVRQEMTENIRLARLEHPEIRDEDVPPMEELIEDEWKTWFNAQDDRRGWVRRELGRSLPRPLMEYLRDWLAAHPGTPDSMR